MISRLTCYCSVGQSEIQRIIQQNSAGVGILILRPMKALFDSRSNNIEEKRKNEVRLDKCRL